MDMPVHSQAWTCLSIVKLECTSPAKRFLPKTVNDQKFSSTQSLTFTFTKNQSELKNEANMETLRPTKQNDIVAINNSYKVLKNEHRTSENENKQIHSQIKIHNEHMKNITEIDK